MQVQSKTIAPIELLEKLGVIAAKVYAIGIEEDDDEIGAFRDVIGIVGEVRELPGEAVDKAIADMASLFEAIRNAEPGQEDAIIDTKGKWIQERDTDTETQIILTLRDAAESVDQPAKRKRVDGLISYLKDFWESPI